MPETLYKITRADGSLYYGTGRWHLPKSGRPGKWMPKLEGVLIACKYGYHLCRADDLLDWLGECIWHVEYSGEVLEVSNKIVVRRARLVRRLETWNERAARLFACDCAERVLNIFEKQYPKDKRPRQAILTVRRYANGRATKDELAAARDAAWAAWDAWDARAARDAEIKWQKKRLWKYLSGELPKE